MKNLFGKFIWNSNCPCPNFVTDAGAVIEHIDISRYPDFPPTEEHISVTLDGNVLVEYRRDQSVAAAPSSTHVRVAMAYVKTSFDDDDQEYIDKRAKSMQDHFNRAFQGRRTMEAVGFLVPLEAGMRIDLDNRAMWAAVRAVAGEEFTAFHIVGGARSGYCGIARLSGDIAITYSPWSCFESTDRHEGGHSILGYHHSSKDGIEYGEVSRDMGGGRRRRWFNAPHLYYRDGLDENHVEEFLPDESGLAYLVSFNTLELAVPTGAKRMLHLRQSGEDRMVAVSLDEDHLDVHVPFTKFARSWSKTNHVATIRRGQSAEVAGRHISFEDFRDGVASVVIDHGTSRKAWPSYPQVGAVGFDDALGLWGNPHWGKQGLHILPGENAGTLRVTWLVWDYDYNPIWFSGELEIQNGAATGTLDLGGKENPEVTVMLTGPAEGLFRARLGAELFATPLKRISRARTSQFRRLADGRFMTEETTTKPDGTRTRFGYLLDEGITPPLGILRPNWKLVQDGVTYEVTGGMRGTWTEDEPLKVVG